MLAAVVLARRVETASFAAYSYFQLTVSMIATYAALGLGVAASRYFAEAGIRSRSSNTELLGTLWFLSMILAGIALFAVLVIPRGWLDAGMSIPRPTLAIGVMVLVLQVVPDGAILGLEQYRSAALITLVAGCTVLAGIAVASNSGDVRHAMSALIVASLVQSAGEVLIIGRVLGWGQLSEGLRPRLPNMRTVLRVSGPMFLVSLLSGSGSWLVGRIILAGPGGQREFALYTIGLQWFALAMFIPGTLARVLLPRLVREASTSDDASESRRLVRTAFAMTTGAAAVIAGAGLVVGPWAMRLYGVRYSADGSIIVAFLAAAVLTAPANSVGNALVAHDRQWEWLFVTIAWAALLLAVAFALQAYGAVGGGAAYAIAYAGLTIGALGMARRYGLV